jgi:mevalonate kinase
VRSSTRDVVGDVRRQWQADPARFQGLFAACGRIAEAARQAIEAGKLNQLGVFMQENQAWLREMSVSAPELEWLVETAVAAGALGAKLSGAGRGGNMIALVMPEQEEAVRAALLAAGAHQVLASTVR